MTKAALLVRVFPCLAVTLALVAACSGLDSTVDVAAPPAVPHVEPSHEAADRAASDGDQPDGQFRREADAVMAYLRGDQTLRDLSAVLTLPGFRMVSFADVHTRSVELRDGHDGILGEGESPRSADLNSGAVHELSVDGLARFFSAEAVGGALGGLDRFTPQYYPPTWFYYQHFLLRYHVASPVPEYVDYLRELSLAVRGAVALTRLEHVLTIHESVFPSIWCLQSTAVDVEGLLAELILDVADTPLDLARDVAAHPEVRRRAEAVGMSTDSVFDQLFACADAEYFPLFNLRYDFADVHGWLHPHMKAFLVDWVAQNDSTRASGLLFVDK